MINVINNAPAIPARAPKAPPINPPMLACAKRNSANTITSASNTPTPVALLRKPNGAKA